MTFYQPNWTIRGDVYNTAGDLVLSKNATPAELADALRGLRADLAALEIERGVRAELTAELHHAEQDAVAPVEKRSGIVARLRMVKERLESLDGATAAALSLAKTIGAVAVWVAALA